MWSMESKKMISRAEQIVPAGREDQAPRRCLDFREGFDLGRRA